MNKLKVVVYVGGEFDPLYKEGVTAILKAVDEVKETADLIIIGDDGSRDYKFNVPHETGKIAGGEKGDINHPYFIDPIGDMQIEISKANEENVSLKAKVEELSKANEENVSLKAQVEELSKANEELKKQLAPNT